MEFLNDPNRQVALSADFPNIDLMLPSSEHTCYLCNIELYRFTRMIVLVNPTEPSPFYQERYRNYCVRCVALNAFEISGPSQMLTYYVCPSLNKSELELLNWTPNQASKLFECISRRCVTKGSQLYLDFIKDLRTRKQEKHMVAFYEQVYSSYFKNTDFDHRYKKKKNQIEVRNKIPPKKIKEIEEIQINVKDKKKHFQEFTDLLHSNQAVVLPENVQHDYFLKLLASKEVQQTFSGNHFKKQPSKRQSELLAIIVQGYSQSQNRKRQLKANINQLYESYHLARQGLHIRQNVEVNVSKETLFNYDHPEMKELSKLENFQTTFNKLTEHRQELINMSKLFKLDGTAKKQQTRSRKANNSQGDTPVTPKKKERKRPTRMASSEKDEEEYNPREQRKKVEKQKRMIRQLRKLDGESSSKKSSRGSGKDSSRERKSRKKY